MWARFRFWAGHSMPGSVPHKNRECQMQADHTHTRQSLDGLVIYASSLSRRINYTLIIIFI